MAAPNSGPSPYFPFPYSLQPLGNELRLGLIGPGLLGLLSVASTSTLLAFILYRFFAWRKHYRTYIGYVSRAISTQMEPWLILFTQNQYVVLIMNLLIADLQQGSSFLISFHWIRKDAMLAPSQACFAQGWLLNLGDVASGFFVFFIAMHTFYTAVKGRRVQYATFASLIIFTWVFSLALTAAGPLTHRADYFVRAGAWCWASSKYERDRLAYHYIWVFVIEFGTIVSLLSRRNSRQFNTYICINPICLLILTLSTRSSTFLHFCVSEVQSHLSYHQPPRQQPMPRLTAQQNS